MSLNASLILVMLSCFSFAGLWGHALLADGTIGQKDSSHVAALRTRSSPILGVDIAFTTCARQAFEVETFRHSEWSTVYFCCVCCSHSAAIKAWKWHFVSWIFQVAKNILFLVSNAYIYFLNSQSNEIAATPRAAFARTNTSPFSMNS